MSGEEDISEIQLLIDGPVTQLGSAEGMAAIFTRPALPG
jgi:hypothetical protein